MNQKISTSEETPVDDYVILNITRLCRILYSKVGDDYIVLHLHFHVNLKSIKKSNGVINQSKPRESRNDTHMHGRVFRVPNTF